MYRAHQLSEDEINEIHNQDLYDVNELNGYELRAYSFEEVSKNPARFKHIKDYMCPVELMHTTTDYKACAIAHGMPANTSNYSYTMLSHKVVFLFNGCELDIAIDDLDKFTTTTKKAFFVIKRERINVDVADWMARELKTRMEKEFGVNKKIDLSYSPIQLSSESCTIISTALIDLYDGDELYLNDDLARLMIELLRALHGTNNNVFIEFQD
jgi:hypothetical protein